MWSASVGVGVPKPMDASAEEAWAAWAFRMISMRTGSEAIMASTWSSSLLPERPWAARLSRSRARLASSARRMSSP